MNNYIYSDLNNLSDEHLNKKILLAGRIHNMRDQKNISFLILRKQLNTLQCVLIKKKLGMKYKDLIEIPSESYIELYGTLNKLPDNVERIKSCSYQNFEFLVEDFALISKAHNIPFSLIDANDLNCEDRERNQVLQVTRLDNRFFDLRAPINYSIFKIQSQVCQLFRNFLNDLDFIEIHSPKIIATASEGGSQIFPIKFFDKNAYLAQSPQLYKQMCINSDFERVYEIGPVYRAENTHTHRHLCEFIGLDVEYSITPSKTYDEIFDVLWNLLVYIQNNIKTMKEYKYIQENYKFEELCFPQQKLVIDFREGVKLLLEKGYQQTYDEDLSTENERFLGKIIKEKYNSDMFILNKYPTKIRPFYTMPDNEDNNFSNSYDVIMRGEEIASGSQRIHDYELLLKNIQDRNLNPQLLKNYLDSFSNGSKPHCGFGLGLERIIMLIFDLKNIRRVSLYPRDPHRLSP